MSGLRIAVLLCVFIIERVASQTCNCQSELFISIDDLVRALNNGPGIPGLIENQGQCGCQQSSQQVSVNQQYGNQDCGCQPSKPSKPSRPIQVTQPLSISNVPLSLGNQCGCQPSISISQPNQQCGCQQPLSISQPSQQCNCQPSISVSRGSQCGCQPQTSLTISQPSFSFQPSSLGCGQRQQIQNVQPQNEYNQCKQVASPEVPAYIVPAALLQAPPYGILFAGDNLLIDGAVQVCGNMPFSSIVDLSGILPSSGSGYVQYVCNDDCD